MINYYISKKIQDAIEKHLFSNVLIENSSSPLILGIFGPTGEGKTFQLESVLNEWKIKINDVSASELENENSGYPAQLLRTQYIAASNAKELTVLVINDIDAILGKWGDLTQYTVNRQDVIVQLMHFCDNPYDVAGTATKRVPIFVTGNNPSILYEPLKRSGRMRMVEWDPTVDEKRLIVAQIFKETDEKEIKKLVELYPTRPISFWSDLHSAIVEDKMMQFFYANYSIREIRELLQRKQKFSQINIQVSLEEIKRKLNEISDDLSNKTYLGEKNY
ncbi:AAA family ATPase [Mediterraneibacter glycyrrhizinilyticus]|uniref:AAA family ATPase n=1 Tax=Mediterraneibacter glycyrrhizinilyticus TaxID=342942 RepID=UPI0025A3A8E3|nr:AAA family ATPase [Mediterraneibacter glycyrrhizinilyticus]MDM8211849.1 AAA family ATPase [Mediterraneibacter glycyrrhizinilyticus]